MSYGCKDRTVDPGRWVQDGWNMDHGDFVGHETRRPRMIWLKSPWAGQPQCGHNFRRDTDPGCEGCSLR